MAEPTTDSTDRTAAITARYTDWYESRDEWQENGLTADWSLRDSPETLSHAIVREDIPWLLEQLATVNAECALLQQQNDELGAVVAGPRPADLRAIKSPAWVLGYQAGAKHQFESSRYRSSLTVGPELEPPEPTVNPYEAEASMV